MFSGRRKYEDVRLKVVGEAKLRLGGKEVDALLLRGVWDDRQVDFWLAPDWLYIGAHHHRAEQGNDARYMGE